MRRRELFCVSGRLIALADLWDKLHWLSIQQRRTEYKVCVLIICRRHILCSRITSANTNRLGRNFTGRRSFMWHATQQTFGVPCGKVCSHLIFIYRYLQIFADICNSFRHICIFSRYLKRNYIYLQIITDICNCLQISATQLQISVINCIIQGEPKNRTVFWKLVTPVFVDIKYRWLYAKLFSILSGVRWFIVCHGILVIILAQCRYIKTAQRIFKYSDVQYTSLTLDKKLNILIYKTLFYVNICGSNKLLKKSGFWPTLYLQLCYRYL